MTYEEVSQLDFTERLATLKLAYLILREEQVKKTPQMFKNFAFFKKHTKEEFFTRAKKTYQELKDMGAHDLSLADAIEITRQYTEIALMYHATTHEEIEKNPDWIESSLVILWGFEQQVKNMENSVDGNGKDDQFERIQALKDKTRKACEHATNAGFEVFTKSERKKVLRILREAQNYVQESISILTKNSLDNEDAMKALLNVLSTMVILSGVGDDGIARAQKYKKSHKK